MEVSGELTLLSGIQDVQVGDALAHGQKGFIHCVSSDRVVGGSKLSVADAEDEEVAQSFLLRASTEGRGHSKALAELGPLSKVGGLGLSILGSIGSAGVSTSNAEVNDKAILGGSRNSTQALSCG